MRFVPQSLGRYILLITGVMGTALVGQLRAAEKYSVTVATNREDAIYNVGEQATFMIKVKQGAKNVKEGIVSYQFDNFLSGAASAQLPKGELSLGDADLRVVVQGKRPGFLRCQVTYQPVDGKPLKAIAGVGFSPAEILPSLPVPDDFDEFWTDQKQQLATVPVKPILQPVEHADRSIECFDVQVPCLGGAPVSGYFAKPRTAAEKSLPAILWVHGAGVRSSNLVNAVKGARSGMLSVDINAHGLANGQSLEFYAKASTGPLNKYRLAGREDRNKIYFRGMYLRLVRAIDFLTSQPEWNGRDVVVVGHSQGGGQAIVAGGLDDRVTMIASGVPAICDHSGVMVGRVNGWPKLVPIGSDGKAHPKILEASRYVDAVNFASRSHAEAIMSVGFIDSVCPPSSCYAAYNVLQGKKKIINEPLMGHAAPQRIQKAFFDQILKHVNRHTSATTRTSETRTDDRTSE